MIRAAERDVGGPYGGSDEPRDLDETTLVARAQDGDVGCFEILVDRYQVPLFRHAFRIVRDRTLAEDVVQDTLVTVWRKLPTLVDAVTFPRWVHQIVTRRSLDVLRRQRPQVVWDEAVETAASTGSVTAGADPAGVVQRRAELQDLQAALATLPATSRACWLLRDVDGFSYAEIAETLDLPVSTVRGALARARRDIVERMAPWR